MSGILMLIGFVALAMVAGLAVASLQEWIDG
jgi:Tfp pilus assembly protein FimT